jgi:adenylate cyclase
MADVFVSYARPDEPQAKRVADALRNLGFSVWRDDELPLIALTLMSFSSD